MDYTIYTHTKCFGTMRTAIPLQQVPFVCTVRWRRSKFQWLQIKFLNLLTSCSPSNQTITSNTNAARILTKRSWNRRFLYSSAYIRMWVWRKFSDLNSFLQLGYGQIPRRCTLLWIVILFFGISLRQTEEKRSQIRFSHLWCICSNFRPQGQIEI